MKEPIPVFKESRGQIGPVGWTNLSWAGWVICWGHLNIGIAPLRVTKATCRKCNVPALRCSMVFLSFGVIAWKGIGVIDWEF